MSNSLKSMPLYRFMAQIIPLPDENLTLCW